MSVFLLPIAFLWKMFGEVVKSKYKSLYFEIKSVKQFDPINFCIYQFG